jgi:hypothetical protein
MAEAVEKLLPEAVFRYSLLLEAAGEVLTQSVHRVDQEIPYTARTRFK